MGCCHGLLRPLERHWSWQALEAKRLQQLAENRKAKEQSQKEIEDLRQRRKQHEETIAEGVAARRAVKEKAAEHRRKVRTLAFSRGGGRWCAQCVAVLGNAAGLDPSRMLVSYARLACSYRMHLACSYRMRLACSYRLHLACSYRMLVSHALVAAARGVVAHPPTRCPPHDPHRQQQTQSVRRRICRSGRRNHERKRGRTSSACTLRSM